MSAPHLIFELRTSQNSEHTPETAAQLFATLPNLKNKILNKILKNSEKLSFEIFSLNQTIYFCCYCPARLVEYLKSLFKASYPQVLITQLDYDPIDHFTHPQANQFLSLGHLKLENAEYFPLKDYHDFTDIDPISTILSTLSKSKEYDQIVIQYLISKSKQNWRKRAKSQVEKKTIPVAEELTDILEQSKASHPQKKLIHKKLASSSLKTTIRLVVNSNMQERSDVILENLTTSFQAITQSESNSLKLNKNIFLKNIFLKNLKNRDFSFFNQQHLSIEELATLYHLPNKQLSTIPNIAWGKKLLGEPPEDLPIVTSKTNKNIKKNINPFAQVIYKNKKTIYGLKKEDRRRHMYVIGKTGTGKTTLLANMAINDLKNNEGLCVVDPHGDLVETLLDYIPSRRINDVIYFDPAETDRTVKLNLFEGENVQHRELIASGILAVFYKLYSYSWGPRLEYILRNSLLTLLHSKNAKLSNIIDLLTNQRFRDKILDQLDDKVLKSFWLYEFAKMPLGQRTEAISPILNKIGQFVTSPLIRNVINANSSSFSIEEVMDQGKILLVNLSQGKLGEDNATLLGAMLITKIQLAAMSRVYVNEAERKDFFLYVDEFQNFATKSFNKILSEARKYRLNLTLANQYIAQIPEEVQKAIFGNCGTMISFIMGSHDAQIFSKEFGGKFTEEDLVSLDRYQIINKISIDNIVSSPFPAYTLPLAQSKNQNKQKVIRVSRERYAKNR